MNDFKYETKNLNENKSKLIAGIELLKSNQDIKSIFKDYVILNFIEYVYEFSQANLNEANKIEIGDFLIDNEFHLQLIRIDEHLSEICGTLDDESENEEDRCKISILGCTQYATNDLFFFSRNAKIKYFENGGTKNLVRYLKNETFVNKFCHTRLFLFILSNINVLSKEADLFKNEWAELNAVDALLKISAKNEALTADAFTIIVRIAYDNDLNNLTQLPEVITLFMKFLNKGAKIIKENGNNARREKLEFGEGKLSKQYDVLVIFDDENYTGTWSIVSIMDVLYRLAINDKIKYDFYVKYNLKEPLRVILFNGSEIEKRYALKILAQLCFDSQVLELVAKDNELVSYLNVLSKETFSDTVIFDLCKQIIWSFNVQKDIEKPMQVLDAVPQKYQVMISYNSASRDLCIKMKTELEKAGYRVWIDINEIHGSSLDSMAHAVDTSDIVLLCVTEKYRQSLNCQAEAQYAFKRKKIIIPLIMQKGYEEVGGWLGMIMGDKIFINFIKHSFDDAVKRLLNQIGLVKPTGLSVATDQTIVTVVETTAKKPKDISEWSEGEVEKWFQKEGNITIYNYLKPCDGKLLTQLHDMQINAPEFFYQFISVKNQIDGRAILVFSMNLKELFKNKSLK